MNFLTVGMVCVANPGGVYHPKIFHHFFQADKLMES